MVFETILLAFRQIRRNALRSSLTVLGIVIGVAAVITMVTLGQGATAQVTADIAKLGSNMLQVRPGQDLGPGGGARTSSAPLKISDGEAIAREVAGVRVVAPASDSRAQAIYGNQNAATQVTGTTSAFLTVRDWALAAGRPFTDAEERSGAAVCVLGQTVRNTLFGKADPIGARVRLGDIAFTVLGVLQSKGQTGFGMDQDDVALVPLAAFQRRISGRADVSVLYVSAKDGVSTSRVQADME